MLRIYLVNKYFWNLSKLHFKADTKVKTRLCSALACPSITYTYFVPFHQV